MSEDFISSKELLRETAAALAHRGCCGTEHDPANGKLHGYCVVCGVPWPCETAQYYLRPPAETNVRMKTGKPSIESCEHDWRDHPTFLAWQSCSRCTLFRRAALKANACQCDPNPSIGGSPPCPVHDGESESDGR